MSKPQILKQMAVFELTGEDTAAFLNNQIISSLSADKTVHYSAICNPKGRILFSLLIFSVKEAFFVAVNADLSDNFFQYVSMRKFRMKLSIKKSDLVLTCTDPESENFKLNSFELSNQIKTLPVADETTFWQCFFNLGLPWITSNSSEQFIPQHVNLDQQDIIDFKKGCYPGQEIVARLHYIGKVKKRMQLLNLTKQPTISFSESIFNEELSKKIEACSPAIAINNQWRLQAILPI